MDPRQGGPRCLGLKAKLVTFWEVAPVRGSSSTCSVGSWVLLRTISKWQRWWRHDNILAIYFKEGLTWCLKSCIEEDSRYCHLLSTTLSKISSGNPSEQFRTSFLNSRTNQTLRHFPNTSGTFQITMLPAFQIPPQLAGTHSGPEFVQAFGHPPPAHRQTPRWQNTSTAHCGASAIFHRWCERKSMHAMPTATAPYILRAQ